MGPANGGYMGWYRGLRGVYKGGTNTICIRQTKGISAKCQKFVYIQLMHAHICGVVTSLAAGPERRLQSPHGAGGLGGLPGAEHPGVQRQQTGHPGFRGPSAALPPPQHTGPAVQPLGRSGGANFELQREGNILGASLGTPGGRAREGPEGV